MALGVKGKGKQRGYGGEDDPGQPETAHMHETHDVLENRRSLGKIAIAR
jgi:hypothetical protein